MTTLYEEYKLFAHRNGFSFADGSLCVGKKDGRGRSATQCRYFVMQRGAVIVYGVENHSPYTLLKPFSFGVCCVLDRSVGGVYSASKRFPVIRLFEKRNQTGDSFVDQNAIVRGRDKSMSAKLFDSVTIGHYLEILKLGLHAKLTVAEDMLSHLEGVDTGENSVVGLEFSSWVESESLDIIMPKLLKIVDRIRININHN